jgi:hypothetical protein
MTQGIRVAICVVALNFFHSLVASRELYAGFAWHRRDDPCAFLVFYRQSRLALDVDMKPIEDSITR